MNKHRKNDAFDDTLYRAFHDYYAEDIPSDEELKRLFPLPEDYLQRIDDMIAEVNRREKRNAALAHLKRAAVIVLVTATAAFSALLCNSGVRAAVRNTLLDWFGDHVRLCLARDRLNLGIIETGWSVGYFYLGIQHRLSAGGLRKGAARL